MTGGPAADMSAAALTRTERSSYFAFVVLLPLLGASLAVNGSAVFQIIAIEELGLTSRQVGLAVGLGAISIPFQIWAIRIPLRAAHRNLRLFVFTMSALCLVMAWLITGPGSPAFVVACVIVIAVLAELAVSVLFATSFQPLLSTTVDPQFRQRLNGQARAMSGLLGIGLVLLVGWTSTGGRVGILIGLAVIGVLLAPLVSRLRRPVAERAVTSGLATEPVNDAGLTWILLAIAISVFPAWPFFVTYAADTFWPSANLGLVGAALVVGGLGASASWRPTVGGLLVRAQVAAMVLFACGLALIPFSAPLTGTGVAVIVLGILIAATAAGTVVRMSLLEMAHARVDESTSVAVLTRLDVIASTTMQVGFLAAGYLIDASVDSTWFVDPFQLSLIAGGALLIAATTRIPD